jgi:hypothetical protein
MPTGLRFSKLGAQVSDLQGATADRLLDAEALFAAGRFASAVVMGVYALEIQLKVLICKRLNLTALPKAIEIHELESLLVLSGLQAVRDAAHKDVKFNWEKTMSRSLQINDMRYSASVNLNQSDAVDFFQQLRDPPHGVLPWLLSQP